MDRGVPVTESDGRGTVAKTFTEEFICRFGPPEVVHTDQGKNFQSQLFREVLALLEIRQTRTCAFRPQSDGMVERANRTIEMMLAATVAKDQRDWDCAAALCNGGLQVVGARVHRGFTEPHDAREGDRHTNGAHIPTGGAGA